LGHRRESISTPAYFGNQRRQDFRRMRRMIVEKDNRTVGKVRQDFFHDLVRKRYLPVFRVDGPEHGAQTFVRQGRHRLQIERPERGPE
jgi:hypothetical protein